MTTQTLQDIVGKEPHHWRGHRLGLEQFANAFHSLLGGDAPLPPVDLQEFEDFLATISFPPNPYRNANTPCRRISRCRANSPTGRFGPAGQPLPNGNASMD